MPGTTHVLAAAPAGSRRETTTETQEHMTSKYVNKYGS
jgi:hypothetical protein